MPADLSIFIYGNRTGFRTSCDPGLIWAPDTSGGRIEPYAGPRFPTAVLINQGLRFDLRQSRLYVDQMSRWANSGGDLRRMGDDDFDTPNAKTGKSNVFGVQLSGPFSWMARLLKAAGARRVYSVRSPKVLFKYTATDLAKYCDKIVDAVMNQDGIVPKHMNRLDEVWGDEDD